MPSANIKVEKTWKSIKKIYINVSGVWKPVKKGYAKVGTLWKLFFSSQNAPTQLTSPTLSGSGAAFTSITGTAGTYQSGTYISKTSYIGVILLDYIPSGGLVDGLTTPSLGSKGSSPYTITQSDATTPPYYFYYVDAVVGNDSQTYYFYSNQIKSYVGTITDNFNRTVSSGLGTSSSGYVYNLSNLDSTWYTDGTHGVNSSPPASNATPTNYPMEVVELTGKTNITAQFDVPYGGSGTGIAFWVSDAGSWWAAGSYNSYYTTTGTVYTCNQPGGTNSTGCPSGSCNCTSGCNGFVTSYSTLASAQSGCGGCTITDHPSTTNYNFVFTEYGSPQGGTTVSTCNAANVGKIQTGTSGRDGPFYTYYVCTAFAVSEYWTCSPLQYSWNTYDSGSTVTTYHYYTDLNIISANGSAVATMATKRLAESTSGYSTIDIGSLKVQTSANNITVTGYGETGTNLGSLSYSASSPTKTDSFGASYAGLIKTPVSGDGNIYVDNLSIQ